MLRWTAAGAVSAPDTVQIRLQPDYPDRAPVGAPAPGRALRADELEANLRYFTEGQAGPRGRACSGLILSGVPLTDEPLIGQLRLAEAVDQARRLGLQRVVVHGRRGGGPEAPSAWAGVDRVVLPHLAGEPPESYAAALAASPAPPVALLQLRGAAGPWLADVARAAARARPAELVLSWPPPAPGLAPADPAPWLGPLQAAAAAAAAEGVPVRVQGLPACLSPGLRGGRRRTRNRWYVDAEHQLQAALLFLPEVVRFHRPDSCRFCAEAPACDGAWAAALEGPAPPKLLPLGPPDAAAPAP
jgi:hypothetical protein